MMVKLITPSSVFLPLRGRGSCPLVTFRSYALAPGADPGFLLTGPSLSEGQGFLFALTAFSLHTRQSSSVARGLMHFNPFYISLALFCL